MSGENQHAKGYMKKWSVMGLMGRFFVDTRILGNNERGWIHIDNVYLNGSSFGGLFGSATAFSVILQDLLSADSKLLSTETKKLMYQHQRTLSGDQVEMTLGWHIGELKGVAYYFREGGGAGFRSEMRIYPKMGLATVLMANRTTLKTRSLLNKLDVLFF